MVPPAGSLPDDDEHPDGPLPLTTSWAGAGAALVGDPRWWRTHWEIRLQPGTTEPEREQRDED